MDWEAITIDPAGLDCDALLEEWRWLVPKELRPFSMNMFGDWFFEDAAGRVHFLDTVGGVLQEIAPTRSAFLVARESAENADQWYMTELALLCFQSGLKPGGRECLSFKIPPVLGGRPEVENLEVCDVYVHQSITAQIHRQVKDLPEGARIGRILVDGEEP
jgi:hypothetical protein